MDENRNVVEIFKKVFPNVPKNIFNLRHPKELVDLLSATKTESREGLVYC